jgi:hypothetical protein
MADKLFRTYIAPQMGKGTFEDPYRSILHDFIDIYNGDWFNEIDNPKNFTSICTVCASQEAHDKIYNDRIENPDRIIYLTTLEPSKEDLETKVKEDYSSLAVDFKSKVEDVLVAQEIDKTTIAIDAKLEDVLSMIAINNFVNQRKIVSSSSSSSSSYSSSSSSYSSLSAETEPILHHFIFDPIKKIIVDKLFIIKIIAYDQNDKIFSFNEKAEINIIKEKSEIVEVIFKDGIFEGEISIFKEEKGVFISITVKEAYGESNTFDVSAGDGGIAGETGV